MRRESRLRMVSSSPVARAYVSTFRHHVDRSLLALVQCDSLRRLGSAHDGGYVVPVDAITRATSMLSFGLSTNWSFERDAVAMNPSLRVEAYDHSVGRSFMLGLGLRAAASVPLRLAALSPRGALSSLRKVGVSANYFTFFAGRRRHHRRRIWYNSDRESAAIEDAIDVVDDGAPLSVFAKIDVEGTEYRILPSIIERSGLFSALVVEFHDTDICADMFNEQMRALREQFEVVHVHGNNFGDLSADSSLPVGLEITLLNRSMFNGPPVACRRPLPRAGLDAPNDPRRPDYSIAL